MGKKNEESEIQDPAGASENESTKTEGETSAELAEEIATPTPPLKPENHGIPTADELAKTRK